MSQQTPSSSVQNILHMLAAARRPARRHDASASPPPAAGADLAALLNGPYGPQIAALLSGQVPAVPPAASPVGGAPGFAGPPQPWPMQPPFGFHPGLAAPLSGQPPAPPHMASPFGFIAPVNFAQPQAAAPAVAASAPPQPQGHPGAPFLGFFANPPSPGPAAVPPTPEPSSTPTQAANRPDPRDTPPAHAAAATWTAGPLSFGAAVPNSADVPRAGGAAVPPADPPRPAADPAGERELELLSAHIDALTTQRDALRASLLAAPPHPMPAPEPARQHVDPLARLHPAEQVAALLESLHAILHDLQAEHQRQQAEHRAELQRIQAEHRAELQRMYSEHRAELRRVLDVVQLTMRDDAMRVQEQLAQSAAEQHRTLQTALCGLHDLCHQQISGLPRPQPGPEPPQSRSEPPQNLFEEPDDRAVVRLARPDPNTSQRVNGDVSSTTSDARGSPLHGPAHRTF